MRLRETVRLTMVAAGVIVMGLVMSCGGGGRSTPVSLSVPGAAAGSITNVVPDYVEGTVLPESDIDKLSPTLQELFRHPGWKEPVREVSQVEAMPVPEIPTVEEIASWYAMQGSGGSYERHRSVMPDKSASYFEDNSGTYPDPGEYDPGVSSPDWGSDGDSNGLDDRFESELPFPGDWAISWLSRGDPVANPYHGGYQSGMPETWAVYQAFRDSTGITRAEYNYLGHHTAADGYGGLMAYRLHGAIYDAWQARAYGAALVEYLEPFRWYDVMMAAVTDEDDNGGLYYTSDFGGLHESLNTTASVQWFSKDLREYATGQDAPLEYPLNDPNEPPNFPHPGGGLKFDNPEAADSLMVQLMGSDNAKIDKIVNGDGTPANPGRTEILYPPNTEPPASNYAGVFPVFGVIAQRWADDTLTFNDWPWEGPLGFPVSPVMNTYGGNPAIGAQGQYYELYQLFERGIIYWKRYPTGQRIPDAAYIFRVPEKKETVFDCKPDDLIPDAQTVYYGTGGPLGVVAWVWPTLSVVRNPIYFKAFPFGGPSAASPANWVPGRNYNGFTDDYYLWRFRDGFIGMGQRIVRQAGTPQPYDYEAKYVARVMLVLQVDDVPGPDGANPANVAYGDSVEFEVGHAGGGGGPGVPNIILLVHNNGADADEEAARWLQIFNDDGVAGCDELDSADITSGDDMLAYKLVVWATRPTNDLFASCPISGTHQGYIMDYLNAGGNVLIPMITWWFGVPGPFRKAFGAQGGNLWFNNYPYGYYCDNMVITGHPIADGPGGHFDYCYADPAGRNSVGDYLADQSWDPPPPPKWQLMHWDINANLCTMLARDNNGSGVDGGMGVFQGRNWRYMKSTLPPDSGTSGTSDLMLNILNFIDPDLPGSGNPGGGGSGGAGGGVQVNSYVGPLQIGDDTLDPVRTGVTGWVIREAATEVLDILNGGDGSDADNIGPPTEPWEHTAVISVIIDPVPIRFECMAHASPEVNIKYEWKFYPDWYYQAGGPKEGEPAWEEWTRYTANYYPGGVDPDGAGPLDYGDPFEVWVRAWDGTYATFAEAQAAGEEFWDMKSVRIRVFGPMAVDIDDDGTVFEDSYTPDKVTGDVTVELIFKISGGSVPDARPYYDDCWIDWDYDYATFDPMVEVRFGTPPADHPPGAGKDQHFNLVMDDPEMGETYTIAIRIHDTFAPNVYDTYVWDNAVKVSGAIAVVNDNGTTNANAIKTDLTALGAGYTELNSSDVYSASDLASYKLVIWCPADASGQLSTTEQSIIVSYIDGGGNVFLPWRRFGSASTSAIQNRFGHDNTSWYGGGGYTTQGFYAYSGYLPYSGPGGTVDIIGWNTTDSSWDICPDFWLRSGYKSVWRWVYAGHPFDYFRIGFAYDNGTGGDHKSWGVWSGLGWDMHTTKRMNALWNIIEAVDPTLI